MELGPTLAVGKRLRTEQLERMAKAWAGRRTAGPDDSEDGFRAGDRPW